MANAKKVSGAQFDETVLKSNRPVLVDFYATWCGPCQVMGPVLDDIAGQFEGEIDVVKVDIDESPELAEKYGILSIPTLVFFGGGEEIHRASGAIPRKSLAGLVQQVLAAPQAKV